MAQDFPCLSVLSDYLYFTSVGYVLQLHASPHFSLQMVVYMQMWCHWVNPPIVDLLLWSSKLFETSGGASKLFLKLTPSLPRLLAYPFLSWHSQSQPSQPFDQPRKPIYTGCPLYRISPLSFLCSFVRFSSQISHEFVWCHSVVISKPCKLHVFGVYCLPGPLGNLMIDKNDWSLNFALAVQRRVLLWFCLETSISKLTTSTISDPSSWLNDGFPPALKAAYSSSTSWTAISLWHFLYLPLIPISYPQQPWVASKDLFF